MGYSWERWTESEFSIRLLFSQIFFPALSYIGVTTLHICGKKTPLFELFLSYRVRFTLLTLT